MKRQSLCWIGGVLLVVLAAALFSGCSTDTESPSFKNPFDPILGADLPIPDSVSVTVGDNVVCLTWGLPQGEEADEYAVFRKRTDQDDKEAERLLERVSTPEYTDTRVTNGRTYAYLIAAGVNGQFGRRTEEIEAQPGLFTIILSNGDELTRTRSISATYSVRNAEAVRLSEDPGSFTAPWYPATGSVPWTLSPGDGTKTVYARFRLLDGSESVPVFGSIRLDTKAAIQSFVFDGSSIQSPGDVIHFRMVADEPHGSATITVDGVFDSVPLFDDGSNGDSVADDGTYERDLTIPVSAAVLEEEVHGAFTDEAGNSATSVTAPRLLTVRQEPDPVDLLDALVSEPPDAPSVTLRWSLTQADAFSAYRIFRSESTPVDSTDRLVATVTSAATLEFEDPDVIEGKTYYYRVYVQDSFGLETGSNTFDVPIPNLRPPSPVTVETPNSVTTTRIALDWSESTDLDFLSYSVYRNETGAVSDSDQLIAEVSDITQTFWDDTGLQENTTYYYRVYTTDQGGLSTRSNEVEARTKDEAPSPVTLNEPSAISTTRIALDWSESTDLDFLSYSVYRNETGAVSDSDELIADLSDISQTFWDDTDLQENTTYYYRVYTGDQSGLSTRSNEVEGRTKNEAPPAVTLNEASAIDSTAATLSWGESAVHDFDVYQLYRDEISTVTTASVLVVEMDDTAFTSFRDTDLEVGIRYYYRVFVVDDAEEAESTGSNTITLVTQTP